MKLAHGVGLGFRQRLCGGLELGLRFDHRRQLRYVDLELDVWMHPTGEFIVLDQDEFDTLLKERSDLAETAERGRAELLALVESGGLPRWTD